MHRYSFHPTLLLRSPAYPFSHKKHYSLQEHLNCQYFRNALFIASPSFYAELKKADFQLQRLKSKAHKAIFNYLNRLYYRSTPFGLFSGFGSLCWQSKSSVNKPVILGKYKLHVLPTFKAHEAVDLMFHDRSNIYLYSNPSIYKVVYGHRFLSVNYVERGHKLDFHLSSIQEHEIVSFILNLCRKPVALGQLSTSMCESLGISISDADKMIQHFIREHLLLTNSHEQVLHQQRPKYLTVEHTDLLDPETINITDSSYTGLEFHECRGNVSLSQQEIIREGLQILERLCPDIVPDGLRKFRIEFARKFEERRIPLMVALDPEIGVGYRKLEKVFNSPTLLSGLNFLSESIPYKQIHWTAAHALLMGKMQQAVHLRTRGIILDKDDFEKIPGAGQQLPSSLSVLFRPLNEQVYIEAAGGATATAILGRFSLFSDHIKTMLEDVARNEVNSNPGVVFAEINSVLDAHTANVERRLKFYPYEIPVMVYPSSEDTQIISLSDLSVSVSSGRILLWSERLQKEIIPRLSTAYNHARSHLNVYRFLCDLQYQGIRTNFTFDLSHFFPSLDFYPRVSCKGAIISLASWQINAAQILGGGKESEKDMVEGLRSYLNRIDVPRHFATYNGDQQIIFDRDCDSDLHQFLQLLMEKQTIRVKEFPFAEDINPARDAEGRQYLPQFVSALTHQHEVYTYPTKVRTIAGIHEQKREPGQWIYLKIYCHPNHTFDIIEGVAGVVEQLLRPQNLIGLFFFVVYMDPGNHVRVRLFCTSEDSKGKVFSTVEQALQVFRPTSQIEHVVIDTYKRELERYGIDNIETVEELFDTDTAWILGHGLQKLQEESAVFTIASDVDILLRLFGCTLTERLRHCKLIFESLYREFNGNKNMLSVLNEKYRLLKNELARCLSAEIRTRFTDVSILTKLTIQVEQLLQLNASGSEISSGHLCSDLIHMHLNRAFTQQPREQEMVIYFILYQYYKSEHHRSGKD